MAERTYYTVERSKAPMPEWEVLGTHQTFRQALAAAASWQKDTKAPLRVVRVTREVMDAASGVMGTPMVPCPVCGGEAVHAQDVLARTTIAPAAGVPASHAPGDVPPGKWKVDMPDGLYTEMPGDPPGPCDLRKVIGGYVYFVTPRSGKLVALNPPRNAGVAEAPAPAGLLGDALTAIRNLRMLGDGITSAELAWIEDVQKRLHAAAGVEVPRG